jgi:preprotein translocase subunit SecE
MATTDKSVATVKPTRPPVRPQAPARAGGDGFFGRAAKYLGEVRTELKKTHWPSKPELIAQTQVVIGMLILVGVFIAAWDFILGQVLRLILRLLGVSHGL